MAKASLLTNIPTNIAVRIYNLSTAIVHSLTKFLLLTKLYCTLASCFTLGWNGAARLRDGLGRIWWKLQTHNFILKMYFLACAYHVVFITDQFWIKDFFGKNVIFWPKNAFFSKNWQFDPLGSAGQQSCFRIFCLGTNFLPFHEKKYSGTFRQKMPDQFFYFYPNIFGHISSILGIKQVLDNKF